MMSAIQKFFAVDGPYRGRGWHCVVVAAVLSAYWWLLGNPWIFDWCGLSLARGHWFGDTWVALAASDAAAAGLDPFAAEARGFVHVYPRAWNGMGALGLTGGDFLWVGLGVGLGFLGFCFLWLRPRRAREAWMSALLLVSPAFVLGFNRGNVDLVIAPLMFAAAVALASSSPLVRLASPLVVTAGTLLKFYPLAAGLALWGGPRSGRERWILCAILAGLTGLFLVPLFEDYRRIAASIPDSPGFFKFGATTKPWEAPWWGGLAWLVSCGCAWAGWRKGARGGRSPVGQALERMAFLVGSSVLLGCFFAGVSFVYRLVFAVLPLPALWRMMEDKDSAYRWPAGCAAWGVVAMAWLDVALVLATIWMFLSGREEWVATVLADSGWLRMPLQWGWVCALSFVLGFRLRVEVRE